METAGGAVYFVSGPSEFVDVSYELAAGNINIHVLTTLAVGDGRPARGAFAGALLHGGVRGDAQWARARR